MPEPLIDYSKLYRNIGQASSSSPIQPTTTEPTILKPKRKLFKKILLIIGGLILLLVIAFYSLPYILSTFSKDIPPIDDSDLQLTKVDIADSENAYFDLVRLEENVFEEIEGKNLVQDHLSGKIWDQDFVNELLKKNEVALSYFDQAARKPKFQDPAFSDPTKISFSTVLTPMSSFRVITRISSIKAANLLKQGEETEALDEALKAAQIGQKIQDSQGSIIHYLVAIAMKRTGLERIQQIIQVSNLPSEILISYSKKLDNFKENEEGLKIALRGEYSSLANEIGSLMPKTIKSLNLAEQEKTKLLEKAKNNFYFQPNATKALFADHFRREIKNTDKPCGLIETGKMEKWTTPQIIKMMFTENAIGKILYNIVAVSLEGLNEKKCQDDLSVSSTHLLMAIKAYKIERGPYPDSLEMLVPNHISAIPKDPFDGKSIKYSSSKKIIYSIGKDMRDSGGSQGDDWTQMPDPTFKINF